MNLHPFSTTLVLTLTTLFAWTGAARAAVQTKTVDYKVGDVSFKGFLAWDDAKSGAKQPGVIVFPEWWGLNDYARGRAKQLAELGYVAFAADPYGDGKSTTDPKEAGALSADFNRDPAAAKARTMAALEQLKKAPNVDPEKLGAIGYCFGGSLALNLARAGADLKGVVAFHGSLQTKTPAEKGAVKAKILVCHGGDDPMVTLDAVAKFEKEMTDADADWQVNVYSHAMHAFTNPEAGKFGLKGVAYNEEADHRSWKAMRNFFSEVFGE